MHAVNFIIVTKQEILVISVTDFFDATFRHRNDVILVPAIRRVVMSFCSSRTLHRHNAPRTWQQLNCYVKKRQSLLRPTCGLQTAQISFLFILQGSALADLSYGGRF